MSNDSDLSLESVLAEILTWTKLIYGPQVGAQLKEILDSKEKRKVYEATDGHASTRDIENSIGVNKNTVSKWWKEWSSMGIVEPGPARKDRPKRIISLKQFGLL